MPWRMAAACVRVRAFYAENNAAAARRRLARTFSWFNARFRLPSLSMVRNGAACSIWHGARLAARSGARSSGVPPLPRALPFACLAAPHGSLTPPYHPTCGAGALPRRARAFLAARVRDWLCHARAAHYRAFRFWFVLAARFYCCRLLYKRRWRATALLARCCVCAHAQPAGFKLFPPRGARHDLRACARAATTLYHRASATPVLFPSSFFYNCAAGSVPHAVLPFHAATSPSGSLYSSSTTPVHVWLCVPVQQRALALPTTLRLTQQRSGSNAARARAPPATWLPRAWAATPFCI